jgi:hypothetical protein
MEITMKHTHVHFIHTLPEDRLGFLDMDEPFIFEEHTHTHPNPFETDDPEVAYHEYLAERFSR